MKFKIKKEEINETTKNLNNHSERLDKDINDLLEQIKSLREVWQGYDADVFCNFADSYLEFLKVVPNIYSNTSKVIDKANKTFVQVDKDYAQVMKKAAVKHE